jgi:hypothetical protein
VQNLDLIRPRKSRNIFRNKARNTGGMEMSAVIIEFPARVAVSQPPATSPATGDRRRRRAWDAAMAGLAIAGGVTLWGWQIYQAVKLIFAIT